MSVGLLLPLAARDQRLANSLCSSPLGTHQASRLRLKFLGSRLLVDYLLKLQALYKMSVPPIMSSPIGNFTTPLLILTSAVIAIVTYLIARNMFGNNLQEPPPAPSSIPLIGHAVGLSRSSFNYYTELRYVTSLSLSALPSN